MTDMDTSPQDDPAYLDEPRFNNTLDIDYPLNGTTHKATVGYAITEAPVDAAWPVLVFFNGLGGHRLIAALIEGIAKEHKVQVLTVDKHGAGHSTVHLPRNAVIPLEDRTRFMHLGLLAVLKKLEIAQFAVLSHSNGLFYALYFLLHLPTTLTPTSWTISGPFMPPSISGSSALRLATMLPDALPNALGTLLQAAPTFGALISWSGGILSASSGFLSGNGPKPAEDDPGFLERHVTASLRSETMRRGLAESRISIGQEALFSLHGGETSASDSSACIWGIGPGPDDETALRAAFTGIAGRYLHPNCPPGTQLSINVVYGAADGMVPKQGREWLKGVLEEVGLIDGTVDKGAWIEVPEAGHDDILFSEEVVSAILRRVVG
ncbi:Cellobiohydrolase I [Mycena chlorophos]|uniref:Cellobiohydrolase I n=1 Tax=Mycena chlorophos TaxID=658473 RepID=A0A8H6TQ13_MYCCL|nr:Cellobiohydrolase I [Mycena chlorophos]